VGEQGPQNAEFSTNSGVEVFDDEGDVVEAFDGHNCTLGAAFLNYGGLQGIVKRPYVLSMRRLP
jgi:hypothetical protein